MLTLIQCPFHPCVTAVARKRLRSFRQKCRWKVTPKNAYNLDLKKSEWADYAAVQAWCGNLSGNELTRNLSGIIRPLQELKKLTIWTSFLLVGFANTNQLSVSILEFVWHSRLPQWDTVDIEIRVPSVKDSTVKGSSLKTGSRSEYSFSCFGCFWVL